MSPHCVYTHKHDLSCIIIEPFAVAFVETVYNVIETVGSVNICINLTRPEVEISNDFTVNLYVMSSSSSLLSTCALLTSELISVGGYVGIGYLDIFLFCYAYMYPALTLDAIGFYEDITINEERRMICYNHSIYDDRRLELNDSFSLILGVSQNNTFETHVDTTRREASVLIVDNDSEFIYLFLLWHKLTKFIISKLHLYFLSPFKWQR